MVLHTLLESHSHPTPFHLEEDRWHAGGEVNFQEVRERMKEQHKLHILFKRAPATNSEYPEV